MKLSARACRKQQPWLAGVALVLVGLAPTDLAAASWRCRLLLQSPWRLMLKMKLSAGACHK
jgi:hypothetical protein